MNSSLLTQISAIALRSTLRTARQPAVLVSAILFPMMFFAINAYGLDAATSIPGFPADSYLDFAFAFPLVQASLFGSITAGADLARDIESGFFDRLSLTPMRPVALLGLTREENLFLDGEGGWRASYVPALLRRGPFSIAAPEVPDGEPMIRVDLDDPRVSRNEGTPVFLPLGGNSPYLEQLTAVLRAIYVGHHLLDPMIAAFESAGLLRPVNLEARVGEGEVYAVTDALVIDRERLAALGAEELAALHQGGFLQAAFMAAASLGMMQRLVELKASGGQPA